MITFTPMGHKINLFFLKSIAVQEKTYRLVLKNFINNSLHSSSRTPDSTLVFGCSNESDIDL